MKKLFTSFKRVALMALFLTMAASDYATTYYLWRGTNNNPSNASMVASASNSGSTVTFTQEDLSTSTTYYYGIGTSSSSYTGLMWTSGVSQTGNVGGTTSEGATPATQEYYVGSTRYMWTRIKPLVASLKITGTISGSNVSINYAAGFSITADSDTYKLLDVATLTANGGTASYTWAYSTDGGSTYTTISGATGSSITFTLTANTTFKCTDGAGKVATYTVKLSTSCSSGTLIFSEDFGSYGASGSYSADKRRNSCADVPSSYFYVSECYTMKNGGDYAIVTNPVWGGCGDQGTSAWGCDCTGSYWYRNTYDHTQGGYDSSSKLGGMLMLNCKDGSQSNPDVLYQKTVTIPCPNTLLNVSMWVQAAWNASRGSNPVSTKFVLRDGGPTGAVLDEEAIEISGSQITAGWSQIKGTFTATKTTVTIQFVNLTAHGDAGNDLLIDDIEFYACRPDANLQVSDATLNPTTAADGTVTVYTVNPYENGTHYDEVGLEAVFNTATIASPYYYWVRSTDNGSTWSEVSGASGEGSSYKSYTVKSNAAGWFKVGIAADRDAAIKIVDGTTDVCGLATVTNVAKVIGNDINVDMELASSLCRGKEAQYDVTVTNPFDYAISNVGVNFAVSDEGAYTSSSITHQSGASITSTKVSDTEYNIVIPSLPANSTVVFSYKATPTLWTEGLQNTAKAYISYIRNQKQSSCTTATCMWNSSYNSTPAASRATLTETILETCDDFSLTVNPSALNICYGNSDSFTITLKNNGTETSTPTGIKMTLPTNIDVLTCSGTGFTYNPSTGIIESTAVAAGATRVCTVQVAPTSTAGATIGFELTTDHTKTASLAVVVDECLPTLAVARLNEYVCYGIHADQFTVTVANPFGFDLTNVLVGCDWSVNMRTAVGVTTTSGTYSAGVWTIPALASGASATLTYSYVSSVAGENTAKAWISDIEGLGLNYTYANSPVKDTKSQTVTVAPNATIAVTGSSPVCVGSQSEVTITATAGKPKFEIVFNNGVTDLTIPDVESTFVLTPSPAAPTTYSLVSITDGYGCSSDLSSAATATVTVDERPVGNAGTLAPQCNNGTFQLAGTLEKGTGIWETTTSGVTISDPSSPTTQISNVPLNGDVEMTWTVSNGVCDPVTSSVHAINNDCTDLTVTIGRVGDICAGGDLNYTITVTNGSTVAANNVAVTITKPDDSVENLTFATMGPKTSEVIDRTYSSPASTGSRYLSVSVTARKEGGSSIGDFKNFWVYALPREQSITASSLTYCNGSSVTIGLGGSQNGVDYTLYRGNGVPAATEPGTGSSIEFAGRYTEDTYTVKAVNPATSCQLEMPTSITIKENELPTVSVDSENNIQCLAPFNGSYTIIGDGGTAPYTYSNNGGAEYTTTATYSGFESVSIQARVKDANGCESTVENVEITSRAVTPTVFNVIASDTEYCAADATSGVTITLSNSEVGFDYQLQKDGATVKTLAGSGSALDFGTVQAGTYKVYATNATTGCSAYMNGEITVVANPLPRAIVTATDNTRCVAEFNGSYTITAEGGSGAGYLYSINGAEYSSINTKTKQQSASDMVTVKDGKGCVSEAVPAKILDAPVRLQTFTLTSASNEYCEGTAGVELSLNGSEDNVEYTISEASGAYAPVMVAGTGSAISFGAQKAGTYTVHAVNVVTGCEADMTGEITVRENERPKVTATVAHNDRCSEPYNGFYEIQASAGSGNYKYSIDNGATYGSQYRYENLSQADKYVRAKDSKECVSEAYHVIVRDNTVPLTKFDVVSDGGASTYCSNEDGVEISLSGSENDVVYTLYKDDTAVGDFSGSGSALSLGKRLEGTYTVSAVNPLTGCTADMNGSVTLHSKPAPVASSETVDNTRCLEPYNGTYTIKAEGGSGAGYTYSNNNGLTFGNQYFWDEIDSADFYAKVKDGDGCISDPVRVVVKNMASDMTVYDVQFEGAVPTYCANTEGVMVKLSGSQNGAEFVYTLIETSTGTPVEKVSKPGTGSAIEFGMQKAGTYRVTGKNTATGCTTDMNGSVTLTENKVPSATISGSTTVCVGTGAELTLNVTDYFSSYTVTYKVASTGAETEVSTNSFTVTPAATETYNIVKVEDANNCVRTYADPYADAQTAVVTVDNKPVSDAGIAQTQYNNSTFTMAANEPQAGEIGEWIVESVTPSTAALPVITYTGKHNTTVTGVEVGSTVVLKWTVFSALGVCSQAESTVEIKNLDGTTLNLTSQFEGRAYCANEEPKLTITLVNGAPREASDVEVTNAITKASIKSGSVVVSSGSYDYTTNVWTVGDIAQGGTVTLTALAVPASTTTDATIEDKAYVSTANGIAYASYDAAPASMKTSATTTAHAVPVLAEADITVVNNISCDDTAPTGSVTVKEGFYEYSFDGGNTWGTSNKLTGLKNGTYNIKVRSQYECESNVIPATVSDDSVKPTQFNVTGGGEYCNGSALSVHVGTEGSQVGFSYQLYSIDGTTETPVGQPVSGSGSAIDFGALAAGKYTVKAISDISATCNAPLVGMAVIVENPKPTVFPMTSSVTTNDYCEGTEGVVLGLANSENNVQYTLNEASGAFAPVTVAGTGSAITFGAQKAGTYTVHAVSDKRCEADMNGSITLKENKVPSATIAGSTTVCVGSDADLTLNVTDYYNSYKVTYKVASTGAEAEVSDNHFTVTPAATETYNIVKVEDENGCVRTYAAPYAADQTATVTVDTKPVSNAGAAQTQYNNSTFTMAANEPLAGEAGAWTVVSVTPSTAAQPAITTPTLYNTTVTGVEVGSTVVLQWTVSSALGVCASASSTVEIKNVDGTTLNLTSQFENRAYCANEEPKLTITLVNGAPREASDVEVTNAITKASIKTGSVVVSTGSYDYTTNVWTVGDMASGATVTLTALTVPSSTTTDATIEDKAYVSTANGIAYASYDAAPASMKTTATTTAHAVPVLAEADVTVVNNTSCDDAALTGSITVKEGFYEYSFDGGNTWGTSNKLTGLKNGTYNIKVRSQYECESSVIPATVENKSVQPVIQRVTTTNNGEYCEGSTSDVHIKVAGSQVEFDYQLYKEEGTPAALVAVGNPVPGTGSELDFGAYEAGSYFVKAVSKISETCDAFMNDNAVVIVENPKPVLTYKIYEKGTTTEVVSPYVITCNIPEMDIVLAGGATYVWSDGETQQTRTVSESFSKKVYPVSDKGCPGEEVEINITVDKETPKDVTIVTTPADADLTLTCKNQELTLTASSTTANVTYKWNDAAQTEGAVLKVSDISTQATYKVTVTAANGCTSESDVTIKENKTKPVVSIASQDETGADNSLLNCTHPELTLTASVSNTQIVGNCTYEWSTQSQAVYSQSNPITVTSANVYSVVATGENGCQSDKKDKVINEDFRKPVVGITAPTDTLTCNPLTSTIVLTATSDIAGSTFIWNTQETTEQITVSPDPQHADRTYSVVATAPNGCVSENVAEQSIADKTVIPLIKITPSAAIVTCDAVTLTASCTNCNKPEDRIVKYKWNDISFTEGEELVVSDGGIYSVSATNRFECVGTAELNIGEDKSAPQLKLTPEGGVVTCAEPVLTVTVTETSGLANVTYTWSDGSSSAVRDFTEPNTYTVTAVNDDTNCSTEATVRVTENKVEPILNLKNLDPVCMPATVDIATAVLPTSVYDDIDFMDESGASLTTTVVDVRETTTYYVQAIGRDGSGCPTLVEPIVVAKRALSATPTVVPYDECPVPGQKSMRDLVTSDKTNLKFYDSMEGGNEVSDKFDSATENSEYTYYVSNTAPNLCESMRAEVDIHVDGTIDYDLIASATEVIAAQDEVTITVIPTKDARIEKYSWTKNGNVFPSDSDEITDILFTNSEFAVNASGRCNSITKKVTVRALWPTVIIPDGPGKNGEFARGCNITVFNRFNEKVFEGNDGWDGTLNCALAKKGVKADPGVYYYYIAIPDGSTQKGIIEVVKY